MQPFSPLGAATVVSATDSNVAGAFTAPSGTTAVHIANTSATLYVSVALAASGASTTLGGSLTLPPMGHIVIGCNEKIASVSAIGSAAGPTAVVFTPGRA